MVIRELAAKLGLEVDWNSYAKGAAAVEGVKAGLGLLVEWAEKAVDALRDNVKEALEYGDATRKASQAIGVNSEALQELQYAAGLADLSTQELNAGIAILTRTMRAARGGAEEQAKAFRKIGVSITDSKGKLRDADAVLGDIAARFGDMEDGAEKTALSMQLFGRSGSRMIPLLDAGAEGLAEMRREARELGLVMDSDAQKGSEEINDNLRRLSLIATGLWRGAIAPLVPALGELVKQFLEWRKANAAVLRQRITASLGLLLRAVKALTSAFLFVTSVMADLSTHTTTLTVLAIGLTAALVAMNTAAVAAAVSTAAAWAAAAAPFVAIAAAVSGIVLVFNSLARWAEGKDSAIGELFYRARAAMQKFVADPGIGDPWFVKVLREAARLALYMADKIDELVFKLRHLGEAFEKTSATTWWGKVLQLNPVGVAYRTARIGKELANVQGYQPMDERNKYNPSLAYLQGSGANFNSPTLGAQHLPAAGASRTTVQQTIHVTQQPGEDGEGFAQRVAAICDERISTCNEEAAASLPAVE